MKQKISVSRIEKHKLCGRRFVFNYHQERREQAGVAADAGKALHSYMETGELVDVPAGYDVPKLADQMRPLVPDETVLGREVEFDREIEGVLFTGVVDLLTEQSVIDFKTSGSDLRWAKNTRKLADDPQRLLYMEAFPDTQRALWITGSWRTYTATGHERKRESKDKERFKLAVLQPAEEILALPADVDPLSLPLPGPIDKNTGVCEACNAFRQACAFTSECFPDRKKTMRDVLKDLAEALPRSVEGSFQVAEALSGFIPAEVGKQLMIPVFSNKEFIEPPVSDNRYLITNLYVDCIPLHQLSVPMHYSTEWIFKASQEVIADLGLPHVLLVDYGKGPAMLAAELESQLKAHGAVIEHFHLETKSAEGKALVQMLSARAMHVIKGYF